MSVCGFIPRLGTVTSSSLVVTAGVTNSVFSTLKFLCSLNKKDTKGTTVTHHIERVDMTSTSRPYLFLTTPNEKLGEKLKSKRVSTIFGFWLRHQNS